MSLNFQILGAAGRDNALLVRVDSGQALSRLLFDCGDGCLWDLPFGEVQQVDHLFFSHLHMDHVGGFDTFFRCTFDRTDRANHVWGPPGTGATLHHRFRGFLWNLHHGRDASWLVHDLDGSRVETRRFELAEAFAAEHGEGGRELAGVAVAGPGFTVEAHAMDHGTPSLAYVVRETPRVNVDTEKLTGLGLKPGPWLKTLRGPRADDAATVVLDGVTHRLADLQDKLLTTTPGESVAYLTDFLLDDAAAERLAGVLRGCTTVVCESQYRTDDEELARRNYHMTARRAAALARAAGVGRLILFHLSDRYRPEQWEELLGEARQVFPGTSFPSHWRIPE
jgi:ribonuclease Z